jgi:DNA-binding beta-propeller fold protein YncE
MEAMRRRPISRRNFVLGSAGAIACGRQKATGFPGYAFVANGAGRSVSVVDLASFRVWRHIRLDAAPSAVVPHPGAPRVIVLGSSPGKIYEIDGPRLEVTRRAETGGTAVGMRLAPSSDAVWVLTRDPASLVEFPLESLHPRRRIRFASPPDDFDLSRDGRAAVISRSAQKMLVLSLSGSAVERSFTTAAEPSIVRFRFDGTHVLAGSRAGRSVTIFETASGKTVVKLPLPVEPRHFAFTPDGGQLFITGDGMDAVVIVFPYSTEVWETILAGRAPGAMAVNDNPLYLLVSNPSTDSVTVLDIETRKLVAVANVGRQPGHIQITPDRQYALVLNEGSADLAVIRIPALQARRYKSAPLFTMIPVGPHPVGAAVVAIS